MVVVCLVKMILFVQLQVASTIGHNLVSRIVNLCVDQLANFSSTYKRMKFRISRCVLISVSF